MRAGAIRRAIPGFVILSSVVTWAACGTDAADVSGECPDVTASTASTGTSVSSTGGAGTTASSTVASTTASSSSGGGTIEPGFEAPQPDEVASRLHNCHKLTYAQLGNFLRNRGVAVASGGLSDVKSTAVPVFGANQTLGQVFGGSGSACEVVSTPGVGQNPDPLCGANEVCFCNQDDKTTLGIPCVGLPNNSECAPFGRVCDVADTKTCIVPNRGCLDVGVGTGSEAPDGYCVAKPQTAGFLYFNARDAFSVPKLDSRLAEKDEHTTASAMKLMDIFLQAAPQIIANIGDAAKAPACTLGGKNAPMFDPADGSCVEEAVSCLLGMPASDDHLLLCNLIVQKAKPGDVADLANKRRLAVAVLLSGVHSCQ